MSWGSRAVAASPERDFMCSRELKQNGLEYGEVAAGMHSCPPRVQGGVLIFPSCGRSVRVSRGQ